jgi:YfiH family protein
MASASTNAVNQCATTIAPLDLPSVDYGFMDRDGGVSGGAYRSFNLARWIGDEPGAVAENWRRWQNEHPAMTPALIKQEHGDVVRTIDRGYGDSRDTADGMVTRECGIALCIFTADCVPALLVDPEKRVIGALHAGWRGTLVNIAAAGIRAMTGLGARPESIIAALGPAIGMCCFEVDEELAARFVREIPIAPYPNMRRGRPGKAFLDLRAIVSEQLRRAGVNAERIHVTGPCTKCTNDRYFSRRAAGGAATGLQMSFIGLHR